MKKKTSKLKIDGHPLFYGKRRIYKKRLNRIWKNCWSDKAVNYSYMVALAKSEFLKQGAVFSTDGDFLNHRVAQIKTLSYGHCPGVQSLIVVDQKGHSFFLGFDRISKPRPIEEILKLAKSTEQYRGEDWLYWEMALDEDGCWTGEFNNAYPG